MFFVPFFFKEKKINFFFPLRSFMPKISYKLSLFFLKAKQGFFLNFNKFFSLAQSRKFLGKKVLERFNFLDFFFKRIAFLHKKLNRSFRSIYSRIR